MVRTTIGRLLDGEGFCQVCHLDATSERKKIFHDFINPLKLKSKWNIMKMLMIP